MGKFSKTWKNGKISKIYKSRTLNIIKKFLKLFKIFLINFIENYKLNFFVLK